MNYRPLTIVTGLALVIGLSITTAHAAEGGRMRSISQYGITWTFSQPVQAGQFITGDWWVVGPVTVLSVDPKPGAARPDETIKTPNNKWGDTSLRNDQRMRNGSTIAMRAERNRQGFDSRSNTYDPKLSAKFPLTIEPNRSLISTISNPTVPVDNFAHKIMWGSEKKCQNVLRAAAVLTVLPKAPPADAFRPPYIGADKPIYRASALKWNLLKKLPVPAIDPKAYLPYYKLRPSKDWEQMERYFQRPWIETMVGWTQQQLNPNENQTNYGRENSRLVSIASLMLHLDVPNERKEKLLVGLVQYGIDIAGVARAGGSWNWGGGHTSGRKWPVVFASLMLDDPQLRDLPVTAVFHEDAQTYYGLGWCGQTALYWMVQHHGRRLRYEHRPPETWDRWDRSSEGYRVACNAVAWVGTSLAARLTGAVKTWNHDAYFDYIERWMDPDDPCAACRGSHRRPGMEGRTQDPFVDAMWHAYRASAPEQPMAGKPRMFVWTKGWNFKWVPNPKPTPEEIQAHRASLRQSQ